MYTRKRVSLVEYGAPVDLFDEVAEAVGGDRSGAKALLLEAGNRAAMKLGFSYNPISVGAKGVRAIDFAGIMRLTPSLELEIAPKFLGLNGSDDRWREDFFFLSTLSRHGRLLATERLSSSNHAPRDLTTLVARSFVSMYEAQKRRPLRSYRRVKELDFSFDGEPDPWDIRFPSPDGFEQELVRFDKWNCWNADLVGAAKELLPKVRDPLIGNSLMRLIEDLSPQDVPSNRRKPLPTRHRAWGPLHELSVDVLDGFGLSYTQGRSRAPGYLVATWRVWEDLLTMAARLGFGSAAVVSQKGFALGTRTKNSSGFMSKISVYPDCVIESDGTRPRMLFDAKYKGHVDKGGIRISESDVYEALAFSKAADCNLVVLGYPAQPYKTPQPVGTCTVFENIKVDDVHIVGVQIEIHGISKHGAFRQLSRAFAEALPSIFS